MGGGSKMRFSENSISRKRPLTLLVAMVNQSAPAIEAKIIVLAEATEPRNVSNAEEMARILMSHYWRD